MGAPAARTGYIHIWRQHKTGGIATIHMCSGFPDTYSEASTKRKKPGIIHGREEVLRGFWRGEMMAATDRRLGTIASLVIDISTCCSLTRNVRRSVTVRPLVGADE